MIRYNPGSFSDVFSTKMGQQLLFLLARERTHFAFAMIAPEKCFARVRAGAGFLGRNPSRLRFAGSSFLS